MFIEIWVTTPMLTKITQNIKIIILRDKSVHNIAAAHAVAGSLEIGGGGKNQVDCIPYFNR